MNRRENRKHSGCTGLATHVEEVEITGRRENKARLLDCTSLLSSKKEDTVLSTVD